MGTRGIKEAFAEYGAALRNVQWSVSAWASDGSLVVSLWEHHRRKGTPAGMLEFDGSVDRWKGPGNVEFRENVAQAFAEKSNIRLVIVRTEETARVEAGENASQIKKDFHTKPEVIGKVIEWDGTDYAFRFAKADT